MAAIALALAACAGTNFSFDNARQVQVGMTEAQVTQLMGAPYMVTTKGEQQIWVWSHVNGLTGGSQSVTFTFKDGKVTTVPVIPQSFK
jgi:outer membrane protein assembly factor BamE (lipoprotein component of BamABCDE complex)